MGRESEHQYSNPDFSNPNLDLVNYATYQFGLSSQSNRPSTRMPGHQGDFTGDSVSFSLPWLIACSFIHSFIQKIKIKNTPTYLHLCLHNHPTSSLKSTSPLVHRDASCHSASLPPGFCIISAHAPSLIFPLAYKHAITFPIFKNHHHHYHHCPLLILHPHPTTNTLLFSLLKNMLQKSSNSPFSQIQGNQAFSSNTSSEVTLLKLPVTSKFQVSVVL